MRNFSFFLFLLIFTATTMAQVPNNSFENWTSVKSYAMPDYWDNLNPSTAASSIFTCTKGAPGAPGNFYLKLMSKDIPGMGIVPGIAVCGVLDQETRQPVSGFAFDQRPQNFTGNWQYMMFGSGIGYMDITLTRWDFPSNCRQVVANCHKILTGMEMSWVSFTLPFVYYNGQYPDTCMIFLSASGSVPAENDFLYLDNLQFQGNVTGIKPDPSSMYGLTIFPNPAHDSFSGKFISKNKGQSSLRLFDARGRVIREQKVNSICGENYFGFDVKSIPAGLYLLKLGSDSAEISAHIMIK